MAVFRGIYISMFVTYQLLVGLCPCEPSNLVIAPEGTAVAIAGDELRLTCTLLNGDRSFNIEWIYEGRILKHGQDSRISYNETACVSSLLLNPARLHDTGGYECTARNDDMYIFSNSFHLEVLACESSKPYFVSGENVTLGCSVLQRENPPSLRWESFMFEFAYSSAISDVTNSSVVSTYLTFIAMPSLDGHVARCDARTRDDTVGECKFKLSVKVRLNVSITLESSPDGTHRLTCATDVDDHNGLAFTWSSNSTLVTSDIDEPEKTTISMPDETLTNPILIICMVRGNHSEGESSVTLYKHGYFTNSPDVADWSTTYHATYISDFTSIEGKKAMERKERHKSSSIFGSDYFRITLICVLGAIFIALICLLIKVARTRNRSIFEHTNPGLVNIAADKTTYLPMSNSLLAAGRASKRPAACMEEISECRDGSPYVEEYIYQSIEGDNFQNVYESQIIKT